MTRIRKGVDFMSKSKFVFGQTVIYKSPTKENLKTKCVFIRELPDGRAVVMFQSSVRVAYVNAEQLECDRGYAKWVDAGVVEDFPDKGCKLFHLLVCSECGSAHRTKVKSDGIIPMNGNYCPHCGRKMNSILR